MPLTMYQATETADSEQAVPGATVTDTPRAAVTAATAAATETVATSVRDFFVPTAAANASAVTLFPVAEVRK